MLNENQQKVVEYKGDKPLLVEAGPGSGKTRVIIERVKFLINELKINPSSVLVITFTRKAANELKDRIEGKTFKVAAKAGANGKLFGSVTAKDVSAAIKEEMGENIDKRKISMQDIKAFGTTQIEVKVYQGITAKVFVQVVEA